MSPVADRLLARAPRGWSVGTLAFATCGGLALLGMLLTAIGSWRQGVGYFGVALLLACLARVVIPDRMAGLLRVRRKALDVLVFAVLGTGIIVLTLLVRNVGGG